MQAGLTKRPLTWREIFSSIIFFAVAQERHLRTLCLGPPGDLHPSAIGFSGLAAVDDGSTLPEEVSSWMKTHSTLQD